MSCVTKKGRVSWKGFSPCQMPFTEVIFKMKQVPVTFVDCDLIRESMFCRCKPVSRPDGLHRRRVVGVGHGPLRIEGREGEFWKGKWGRGGRRRILRHFAVVNRWN